MLKFFFPQLPNYPRLLAELTDAYFILFLLLLSPLLTTPIVSLEHPVCFLINSQKLASFFIFPSLSLLSFLFSLHSCVCIYTYIYIKYTAKSHNLGFLYIDTLTATHLSFSLTLCRFVSHRVLSRNHSLQKLHI